MQHESVLICEGLLKKLPSLPSCLLVGPSFSHFHPQSLPQSILSALSLPDTKDESLNSSHFQLLPPGLDLVGLFIPKAKDAAELKEKMRTDVSLKSSLRLLEASNEGVYVVLTLNESGVKLYKVQKNSTLEEVETKSEPDPLQHFTLVETHMNLPVDSNLSEQVIEDGMVRHLSKESTYFRFGELDGVFASHTPTDFCVSDATKHSSPHQFLSAFCYDRLHSSSSTRLPCPVIEYKGEEEKRRQTNVSISTILYVPNSWSLSRVVQYLIDAVHLQVERILRIKSLKGEGTKIKPFHFQPDGFPHFVTAFYHLKEGTDSEDDLLEERLSMHRKLFLKEDRPYFRIANAVDFLSKKPAVANKRIRDVHTKLGLKSKVEGGKEYLVDGSYDYYHYMQDNFNDNGWGCAYRSMQTICSWIKNQHYTNKPVPFHTDIQKILVSLGDKPPNFVGSSNWIGAIEISMCLQNLYDVDCSIMHVSSGSELVYKGRELMKHFETHGTPVMIGGGVLAYTLLGIDYNEKTGDIQFLILDPHYTGSEDLKTIRDKGWCSWKSGDLFRQDSFYNLCLPQRPKLI